MTTIHVEPEQLRQNGRNLLEQAQQMMDQIQGLLSGMNRLQMSWAGESASDFAEELRSRISQMQQHAEQMNSMGVRLIHEADAWLEIDQRGAREFTALRENPMDKA